MCGHALRAATWLLVAILSGAACAHDTSRWGPDLDSAKDEGQHRNEVNERFRRGWAQWGQNPQHTGAVDVAGQSLERVFADIVYDPFAQQQQAESGGSLVTHYPAPIVDDKDVFMLFKTGTYISCNPPGSGMPFPCGNTALNSQVWTIKRLHWERGRLVEKWTFESSWKPEPFDGQFEPVFHAALVNEVLYVPGAGGTVFRLARESGEVLAQINPFGDDIDPNAYVAGPLTADARGNIFYNLIRFNPANPWGADVTGSWLVKVTPKKLVRMVALGSLIHDAPILCTTTFTSGAPLPPAPDAVPPSIPCLSQRAGLNVAPAVGRDGTIYTVTRAHLSARHGYVVALNQDLSLKWAASLRGHLRDGCNNDAGTYPGTLFPANGQSGGCRPGTMPGVDPSTNALPAGMVHDSSTSSPTVAPDGSVFYGALTVYNGFRGHLMKFDKAGNYVTAYDFGWDTTPAIHHHNGSWSVILKENHYGSGPYFMTKLDENLMPEWKWQNTNIETCTRNPDGALSCVPDQPGGFEFCINAPAVDRRGVIYANSEDGFLYAINPNGTLRHSIFLQSAIGAAYTPLSIGPDGRIYTQNAGHLFAIGAKHDATVAKFHHNHLGPPK
jgi:outer membrane protein assembly factor BamB